MAITTTQWQIYGFQMVLQCRCVNMDSGFVMTPFFTEMAANSLRCLPHQTKQFRGSIFQMGTSCIRAHTSFLQIRWWTALCSADSEATSILFWSLSSTSSAGTKKTLQQQFSAFFPLVSLLSSLTSLTSLNSLHKGSLVWRHLRSAAGKDCTGMSN